MYRPENSFSSQYLTSPYKNDSDYLMKVQEVIELVALQTQTISFILQ